MATTTAYKLYMITIPLRYNSLDLFSIKKDYEYVVGLDGDLEWKKDNVLDIADVRDCEKQFDAYLAGIREQYPQYECRVTNVYRKLSENAANRGLNTQQVLRSMQRGSEASNINKTAAASRDQSDANVNDNSSYGDYEIVNECLMTAENLVAKNLSDAIAILEPEISAVCNALNIMLASSNCNKQLFQPRVEPDWDQKSVKSQRIIPESQKPRSYIDENGNMVYELYDTIELSVECFAKLYSKVPVNTIAELMKPYTHHYQYAMQEYCAALGTEGFRSKYFHLFCIIEFIEREYVKFAGAKKLLNDEQIGDLIMKSKEILKNFDLDKAIQSNVTSRLKACVEGMTTIGRAQKLVNILRAMGVEKIEDGELNFEIDKKRIQEYIDTRNTLFHGNDSDKELRNLVTELMCIDMKVLDYLRINAEVNKTGDAFK